MYVITVKNISMIKKKSPNCRSVSFKTVSYFGEDIIKNPPKDGYNIKLANYESGIKSSKMVRWIGRIFLIYATLNVIIMILLGIFFIFSSGIEAIHIFMFIIILLSEILIGIILILILNKIKNNDTDLYFIKIEHENSNGVKIPLISEIKYDGVLKNKNGTIDLLIDENDFSNYYIDFDIY